MPLYCYQCNKCENEFCETYKIDDRKLPCDNPCVKCGETNSVILLISRPGAILFDSLAKPPQEFRERMNQIKKAHKHDPYAKLKDY